jgi:transcriptional regulator with XRE-family HTH domain
VRINFDLKEAILKSGYKQVFIARETKIDETLLSKIIHGGREASDENKKALSDFLKYTVDELFPKTPKRKE